MAYGRGGEEASHIETLRKAHELRVTMFDTAELYGLGSGANEQLVGKAVHGFRNEIVLATKFGLDVDDPTSRAATASQITCTRSPRTASATSAPTSSTCSTSTGSTRTCRSRRCGAVGE